MQKLPLLHQHIIKLFDFPKVKDIFMYNHNRVPPSNIAWSLANVTQLPCHEALVYQIRQATTKNISQITIVK